MKKFTMLFVLALFVKMAIGQVSVSITVKNNLSPSTAVSGASVTLTGATTPTVISDANGLATFSVPVPTAAAYYNVAITAAGYLDYTNGSLVYITPTTTTLTKTATIKKAFDISYRITDNSNTAISGASVKINTAPVTTKTTDVNGDVTFNGLYSVATHSTLVTATGYADSTFNVIIAATSPNPFIVPTVKLRNAYNITFTVTNGINPVAGANVTIGSTSITTDVNGVAVFTKKVNGVYSYIITKTGIVDKTGTVTVAGSDLAAPVSVATGYDLAFTIINGATGTTGLQQDTITIDGITKITTSTNKVLTFGVAAGSTYSFTNKKAGFIDVPVTIPAMSANTALTINMIPVYSVKFTVSDFMDNTKVSGVKVNYNGIDIITDATGIAQFTNVAASASAKPFTISGPDGSYYIAQSGTVSTPLTSSSYLSGTNNKISKSITYEKPYIYIGLSDGMMGYYGEATIHINGTDIAYDAGMGGNFIMVSPGTYSYTVTPADVNKAIISGTVTLSATAAASVQVQVVNGKKIEMFVTDATPDQNTIDGASVALDGVTLTTIGGSVVFDRKAVNTNYPYSVSKAGYGTVTGTAALVTADLVITTKLFPAYKVAFNVKDGSADPAVALPGATVTFNGTTATTDANGMANFPDAVDGVYDYSIVTQGFVTQQGSVTIEGADIMVDIAMYPAYSVQFTVTDGINPIQGASVRLVNSWPVSDETYTTDAQGVAITPLLYGAWSSLTYTISATGFADSTGMVSIEKSNLVVAPIALKHAYTLTFTVNDGTNPLSNAGITINNVTNTTDAGGNAEFLKMIDGTYAYQISKAGFVDNKGTVTVSGANTNKTVTLATGYNVTFNVINGPSGSVGLAKDTIIINGISKVTDANGTVVFGVAPASAISFVNKKAGFIDVPVTIASVGADMEQTINMVPVYNVVFRAIDGFSQDPIAGATVLFNSITVTTDMDGYANFPNTAPSADPYVYTITGNGIYSNATGDITLPFTSTEEYLYTNNIVSLTKELTSPGVFISLEKGMMPYYGPATISFDGTDYPYNTGLGAVVINCTLGTHSYIVTPEDPTKAIIRGSVIVDSDIEKKFVGIQIVDGRTIEIYTINSASDPIVGATVVLNGDLNGATVSTDASGLALFSRYPAGTYTYSITKADYKSIEAATLDVNTENVMKVVTMESLLHSVTFNVKSGTEILVGADVTLGTATAVTGADGKAVFTGIADGTYAYTVSMSTGWYKPVSGSITVAGADVTENVDLLNTTGIDEASAKLVKVYPNPTKGILYVTLPQNTNGEVTITITNMIGSTLLNDKFDSGSGQIKLDASGYENGIYFVKVNGNGFEKTIRVVKN